MPLAIAISSVPVSAWRPTAPRLATVSREGPSGWRFTPEQVAQGAAAHRDRRPELTAQRLQ